ncbi:hypothetical protein TWF730_006620 [Orbilia blumenaviensis]|uniref:Uncharacterized protein n=1 Tax=Orbilia blumenaviensis TaxID=1796055 RepID=A0AAV9VFZ1_9PEZI
MLHMVKGLGALEELHVWLRHPGGGNADKIREKYGSRYKVEVTKGNSLENELSDLYSPTLIVFYF